MGAAMFGFHTFPGRTELEGLWARVHRFRRAECSYHVLQAEFDQMTGGTMFHFVTAYFSPGSSCRATAAAGGKRRASRGWRQHRSRVPEGRSRRPVACRCRFSSVAAIGRRDGLRGSRTGYQVLTETAEEPAQRTSHSLARRWIPE